MSGFKVGDKVRVVRGVGDDKHVREGNIVTVGACAYWPPHNCEYVWLAEAGHHSPQDRGGWDPSRFELVSPEPPAAPFSFDGVHAVLGAPEPEPARPEWVRILSRMEPSCGVATGDVVEVITWTNGGFPRVRCDHGDFAPSRWEPAEAPEPTVTIELPAWAARYQAERDPAPGDRNPYYAVTVACRAALAVDQ